MVLVLTAVKITMANISLIWEIHLTPAQEQYTDHKYNVQYKQRDYSYIHVNKHMTKYAGLMQVSESFLKSEALWWLK